MFFSNFVDLEQCPSTTRPACTRGGTPPRQDRERHAPAAALRTAAATVYAARVVPRRARPVMLGTAIVGYTHKAPRITPRLGLATIRLKEIAALIEARYGGPCDTHDGDAYFEVALPCLIELGRDLAAWAAQHLPVYFEEQGEGWFARRADAFARRPYGLSAETCAARLRLTAAERTLLGIRTIGAVDRTKRERNLDTKACKRDHKRRRRLEAGCTPRELSLSQTRPWEAEGISRRTWERRRAVRERDGTDAISGRVANSAPMNLTATTMGAEIATAAGESPSGNPVEGKADDRARTPRPPRGGSSPESPAGGRFQLGWKPTCGPRVEAPSVPAGPIPIPLRPSPSPEPIVSTAVWRILGGLGARPRTRAPVSLPPRGPPPLTFSAGIGGWT